MKYFPNTLSRKEGNLLIEKMMGFISKNGWGLGYTTEALNYAFNIFYLNEVVAFTTMKNKNSIEVVNRLGMTDSNENIMHQNIDLSNSLCEHELYKITKNQ